MHPAILALCVLSTAVALAQRPPVKCTVDSPERRGGEGCTILASRPLRAMTGPLHWHIDRFPSLTAAQKAAGLAGPDAVAAEAQGASWLLAVEAHGEDHRGGEHVAWVGPLELPNAQDITMRVHSTSLHAGTVTPVHTHSGPEVFFIVSGEQCLETVTTGHHLVAGQSFVMPADTIHRGRIPDSVSRAALGLVLHDASRPGSYDLPDPPLLVACK